MANAVMDRGYMSVRWRKKGSLPVCSSGFKYSGFLARMLHFLNAG
jgi:hypothetical protein